MKVRQHNSTLHQDTEKPLRRSSSLNRGKAPQKRRKRVYAEPGFQQEVQGLPCLKCGKGARDGHHFLPQQMLRAHARTHKLTDSELKALLSDRRNRGELCPDCHANEENGNRVPRELVPASAFEFAEELGLRWVLERRYGVPAGSGATDG